MADNRVVVYAGPGQVAIENTEFPKLEIPSEVAEGLGIKQAAPHAVILKLVTTRTAAGRAKQLSRAIDALAAAGAAS